MDKVIRPWVCAVVTVTACWIAAWVTYQTHKTPEWFVNAFVGIVAFYFVIRSYEKANTKI